MSKNRALLFFFSLFFFAAYGQDNSLKGNVKDGESKQPLNGATIKLILVADTTKVKNTITDKAGVFEFSSVEPGKYKLEVSFTGYEMTAKELEFGKAALNLGEFLVHKEAKTLNDVTIVSKASPVKLKGDTAEYSASQYKVNPDATTEDLVRKMPGVTVENGVVKAGGEQVQKVTVDGREFFGDDATATLRNLPAEIVDKIQVFDRMSDQAQFTGVDDGNTSKSINIVTKANMRNGQFGRVFAGYGTDNHYLAGGNMSFFKNNRRISIVGLTNDVNQQNFTEMDLMGVTSSSMRGGFRGGGGGRGGGGFGGGGGGFLIGQQPGVSKTNSLGINFNDKWGTKTDVSGSYFFNSRNISNKEVSSLEYLDKTLPNPFYDETDLSASRNYNHRASFRIDHKIDSSNSILVTPSVSFQRYNSFSDISGKTYADPNSPSNTTQNITNSSRDAISFSNSILYRHSFAKRGRTFSINFSQRINNNDGETYLDAYVNSFKTGFTERDTVQQFTDQFTKGLNLSGNLNYTEPIGKKAILQFSYSPSYSKNKTNKENYILDPAVNKYSQFDSSLSNIYDNTYITQRGGVSYRFGDQDKNISFGMDYQSAALNGDQHFPYTASVDRKFYNFLPNAMIRYNFSKTSNIRLFYRASTNEPSIGNLQEVFNTNNPLRVSTGNPNLKQEYGHRLGFRYQLTNPQKGRSFFFNLFGSTTSDYVANAIYQMKRDSVLTPTFTLKQGGQLTKPVNLDGRWNMNAFATFGAPLNFIKTTMNLNTGFTYNRTPGVINELSTVSNSYGINSGIVLASNISQYVDFTVSYNASFNTVNSTNTGEDNTHYVSQNAGIRLNLLNKKGWLLNNDVSNQSYSGYSDGFNQSFWLWNMAVAKKFLKKQRGELRLSVFDLLGQNQSISRTVDATYIQDVTTQVVKRYFMLTFTYNLKNFGTPPARNSQRGEGGPRGDFMRRF